ncbi:hypothetical protein [Pelagicoccus mobilis]|uniref:Uncharacterized protein n=1 Tax=Pelagicoccus mobilis TaxID=415221 RepID=A0A934RXY0_9BACT|nr:hypothetical protein [Pelagicoccus mobilis]MBK1875583.1 hypothetical protein [Pelagicoccus mobilis]
MNSRSLSRFSLYFSLLLLSAWVVLPEADARRNARVLVDARSTEAFNQLKAQYPDGLTYNLMEGKFFGGEIRDKSLETMPFKKVAFEIATRLEKQGMFVSGDVNTADMLVVISWGTTDSPVDWSELFGQTDLGGGTTDDFSGDSGGGEDGFGDSGGNYGSFDSIDAGYSDSFMVDDGTTRSQNFSTAKLLGIDRALNSRSTSSSEYYELESLLQRERYFIVVQAFDFQKLKGEKKISILWSTRFSMDSTGANFRDAYLSLSRAAAPYFGEHMDDLAKEKVNMGAGEATVGELEVIGILDEDEVEEEK